MAGDADLAYISCGRKLDDVRWGTILDSSINHEGSIFQRFFRGMENGVPVWKYAVTNRSVGT